MAAHVDRVLLVPRPLPLWRRSLWGGHRHAGSDGTFRKVDLNTCSGRQFAEALRAANRHSLIGGATFTDPQIAKVVANFLGYRNRAINANDLARYLLARLITGNPTLPAPANTAWNVANWTAFWTTDAAYTGPATETDYLTWLFGMWTPPNTAAFWDKINAILAAPSPVSVQQPVSFTDTTGSVAVGIARHPYIVELYAKIGYPADVTLDSDPGNTLYNCYAVELYNPWDTTIDLTGWVLRGNSQTVDVKLFGVIPPYGRFVVARWTDPTPAPFTINQSANGVLVVASPSGSGWSSPSNLATTRARPSHLRPRHARLDGRLRCRQRRYSSVHVRYRPARR